MVHDVNMGDASNGNADGLGGLGPSKLAIGAAAELLVASRIALLGYQVYRPLADDRGIDLLVDVGGGRHVSVQVKAVRFPSGNYVFMRKSTFPLEPWVVLALVVYGPLDEEPQIFFISAVEWESPKPPLVGRDYPGGKSAPEYGLGLRKGWRQELAQWAYSPDHVRMLMRQSHDASIHG